MNGKGDAPRPLSVDSETFSNNWNKIFKKNKTLCAYSGLPSVQSYNEPPDTTPAPLKNQHLENLSEHPG